MTADSGHADKFLFQQGQESETAKDTLILGAERPQANEHPCRN
jgi:hypothetical protein